MWKGFCYLNKHWFRVYLKHREKSSTAVTSQYSYGKAISKVIAETRPSIAILHTSTRSNTKLGCRLNHVHLSFQLHDLSNYSSFHSGDPYKSCVQPPSLGGGCNLSQKMLTFHRTLYNTFSSFLDPIRNTPRSYEGKMGGSNMSLILCIVTLVTGSF